MVLGVLLVFEVATVVLYAISGDTLAALIVVLHEVKMVLDLMTCFNFRRFALVILVLMSPCSLSNDCWFESIMENKERLDSSSGCCTSKGSVTLALSTSFQKMTEWFHLRDCCVGANG